MSPPYHDLTITICTAILRTLGGGMGRDSGNGISGGSGGGGAGHVTITVSIVLPVAKDHAAITSTAAAATADLHESIMLSSVHVPLTQHGVSPVDEVFYCELLFPITLPPPFHQSLLPSLANTRTMPPITNSSRYVRLLFHV